MLLWVEPHSEAMCTDGLTARKRELRSSDVTDANASGFRRSLRSRRTNWFAVDVAAWPFARPQYEKTSASAQPCHSLGACAAFGVRTFLDVLHIFPSSVPSSGTGTFFNHGLLVTVMSVVSTLPSLGPSSGLCWLSLLSLCIIVVGPRMSNGERLNLC